MSTSTEESREGERQHSMVGMMNGQQGEKNRRKSNTIRDMINKLEKKEEEKEKDNNRIRTKQDRPQQLNESVVWRPRSTLTGMRLYKTGNSTDWQKKGDTELFDDVFGKLSGVRTRVHTPDKDTLQNSATHTQLVQPDSGVIQTVGANRLPSGTD